MATPSPRTYHQGWIGDSLGQDLPQRSQLVRICEVRPVGHVEVLSSVVSLSCMYSSNTFDVYFSVLLLQVNWDRDEVLEPRQVSLVVSDGVWSVSARSSYLQIINDLQYEYFI